MGAKVKGIFGMTKMFDKNIFFRSSFPHISISYIRFYILKKYH